MKVVAIIQARTGSSRLPNKVLLDLAGKPMLARVVERAQRATAVDEIVIATTEQSADDVIAEMCKANGWLCFRGAENDVLDRYYRACVARSADIVVRITSDDPLIDPQLIDLHVEHMRARWQHVDFVTNMARQTFPFGLAVEAMPMDTLARCHRLSTSAFLREHVTTLVYERPDLFLIEHVLNDTDLSGLRWTVDTIEDFRFVLSVYEAFGHDRFSWRDALAATRETVAACGTSVAGHVRQPECG